MKIFDPHVHMTSRTTDDYETMAAAGILAIVEPAFWLGQPRTQVGSFIDYFNSLLGWERFRAAQFGIRHFCTMGLNPKEANNTRLAAEVMDLLPRFLSKEGVVAVGEIGFDDQTDEEEAIFARHIELAREFGLPILVHTPHRDKKRGTARSLELVARMGFPEERVLIDHNNEETLHSSCRHGVGRVTIYPKTKMDEDRMAALVTKYGPERIIINSAADWGISDPLKVPKTIAVMRAEGIPDDVIQRIVWDHPVAFFAQSGRLDVDALTERPDIARTDRFETNSVLRGDPLPRPVERRVSHPHRTAVLNVVGLTRSLMGVNTPHLSALARAGSMTTIDGAMPAVTCTAQATYLTGLAPTGHGIVGNGWYDREQAQVMFWRQANQLVAGEKVWETARRRDPSITAAKMFWWFNMYSSADWSVTPRPIYPADGRKIPDIYSAPGDLCSRLVSELGPFPFFSFWGPASDVKSSRWIADASGLVAAWHAPSLLLAYLPHLDYNLQRRGVSHPGTAADVRDIDAICGELIANLESRGYRIIVLSEYGLVDVSGPVHINRALRDAGLLAVRRELGLEMLDAGASEAFAVADHQVAHVYVKDPSRRIAVRQLLERLPGVGRVLDRPAMEVAGLSHARAGDLLALAAPDRWFTYYYWTDDRVAPDFARTVDIHRKPGYDPAELFLDPAIHWPKARIGWTLAKKAAGFRTLMRMIPLDATLVRGSHGLAAASDEEAPVLLSSTRLDWPGAVPATAVRDVMLAHLFDG